MSVHFSVAVTVDKDEITSFVLVSPKSYYTVAGQEHHDETTLETHRKASAIYDRVIDFAEQIKK